MTTIDAAMPDDAQAVAQVHVDAWRAAYAGILSDEYLAGLSVAQRAAMWRDAIARRQPELLVARRDGGIDGWISIGPSRDEGAAADVGEVWALYVAPACWRSGAGRLLWQRARERLIERGFARAMLWVFAANPRAIGFYESAGFAVEPASARHFTLGGREVEELRCSTRLSAGGSRRASESGP
jgi:ribosomal protein S18 acetylase RimI-like enzyme